jgi:hypothetical protein
LPANGILKALGTAVITNMQKCTKHFYEGCDFHFLDYIKTQLGLQTGLHFYTPKTLTITIPIFYVVPYINLRHMPVYLVFLQVAKKNLQLALCGPKLPASLEACKLRQGTRH